MKSIYETAKSLLGYHLTLDASIPREYGCAQALSKVLSVCGYPIPKKGISSTIDMEAWLIAHGKEIAGPKQGCIVISATEEDRHGHCGVIARFGYAYPSDWGIMSNTSANGLWQVNYSLTDWRDYYTRKMGLQVKFYEL